MDRRNFLVECATAVAACAFVGTSNLPTWQVVQDSTSRHYEHSTTTLPRYGNRWVYDAALCKWRHI